ncbi:hypothetical protein HB364_26510 [Pseudoflavitalea sp. X16]|uniref:hypothetical protein n=1 Tax=Paraflavitalea devenefica TaxID=2716334 RepID=UPI001422D8B5|nr:hypothetical protein [Paraflavitalea devenefica]NII28664.1 hypothetical protein [Paraflavitalea devenefica]
MEKMFVEFDHSEFRSAAAKRSPGMITERLRKQKSLSSIKLKKKGVVGIVAKNAAREPKAGSRLTGGILEEDLCRMRL